MTIGKRPARIAALGTLLACSLLAGCAAYNYTGPDSPIPQATLHPMEPPPRVALVLSSGGPRGYAHIGVMRVLEEAGIPIDLVVGTSVGSLLGVFWADGLSAAEIDTLSQDGGPLDYVNTRLANQPLEQLRRRVVVGATRRDDKAPVFFTTGNAGVAVRASSAVPGSLSPVGIQGIEYEDGDESLPLAVRAARQAGARFVIAVDVTPRLETAPADVSPAQRERIAQRLARIAPEAEQADFLLDAGLAWAASPLPSYFRYARSTGEANARRQLPQLLARLQQRGLAPQPALAQQGRP